MNIFYCQLLDVSIESTVLQISDFCIVLVQYFIGFVQAFHDGIFVVVFHAGVEQFIVVTTVTVALDVGLTTGADFLCRRQVLVEKIRQFGLAFPENGFDGIAVHIPQGHAVVVDAIDGFLAGASQEFVLVTRHNRSFLETVVLHEAVFLFVPTHRHIILPAIAVEGTFIITARPFFGNEQLVLLDGFALAFAQSAGFHQAQFVIEDESVHGRIVTGIMSQSARNVFWRHGIENGGKLVVLRVGLGLVIHLFRQYQRIDMRLGYQLHGSFSSCGRLRAHPFSGVALVELLDIMPDENRVFFSKHVDGFNALFFCVRIFQVRLNRKSFTGARNVFGRAQSNALVARLVRRLPGHDGEFFSADDLFTEVTFVIRNRQVGHRTAQALIHPVEGRRVAFQLVQRAG